MDLDLTRIFVKVIQNGSFSRAAELLKVPKSTVSKAVARLEQETKTQLLIRTTRSLTLTAAGRAFYDSCLGPIQILEDAQKSLYGSDSILSGLIRLTAPEDLGSYVIAPAIAELTRRHPSLVFDLHYTDTVIDLVRDGFDLAIRVGRTRESSLKIKKAGEIFLIPVASPKYLDEAPKILRPTDLSDHSCLSISVRGLSAHWTLKRGREVATLNLNPRIVSNQMTSLLRMASSGAGIALIPMYLCQRELASRELVRVLPDWSGPMINVSMLSPLASNSSARLKVVSEHLIDRLRKSLARD
jgi:LysR family transcriptional regulator, regulator for bpeEF and oprC